MLANFEFEGQSIREQDGLFSIYDCIQVIGNHNHPRKVWERLKINYSDVVAKSHNLKFEGKGQRLTPVGDRQLILEIIGLLPNEVGKKISTRNG